MKILKDHTLYLVITEEYGKGRSAFNIATAAIAGGVDIIQMREKDKPREELADLGKKLAQLCKDKDVIFIANNDPFIAKAVCADGLHLGQEDIKIYPLNEVRKIMGPDKIIGISTHSMEQFAVANSEDFDYIAFGPIFETKTKGYHIGAGDVGEVARIARKPVFFIGGINLSNIGGILKLGAKRIALIRGITEAEDIMLRTKEFKDIIKG
ncbi:MAG: thiamine phosphate synthase [Candidatus Omnitrophota bacterium]|jgi:thiamine-phosphate pyrophosphorylase